MSLKNYRSVVFSFYGDEGRTGASDDTTITLQQATTAAGGNVKTFTPRRAYRREGSTISNAIGATATVREGDSLVTNGNGHSILDVEIDASELDVGKSLRIRAGAVRGSVRRNAHGEIQRHRLRAALRDQP